MTTFKLCTTLVIIFFFWVGTATFPSFAENGTTLSKLVGLWGDEEMCLAHQRNDFYYVLEPNGKFYLKNGDEITSICYLSIQGNEDLSSSILASCSQSKKITDIMKITNNIQENRLEMTWKNKNSNSLIYLHKCNNADKIMGIGQDPNEINGDLGVARHAHFTISYAETSAEYCKSELNTDITRTILAQGANSAEKYALSIRSLPTTSYAQDLAIRRTKDGLEAANVDIKLIPDFCRWFTEAYGANGWVIKDLIVHP